MHAAGCESRILSSILSLGKAEMESITIGVWAEFVTVRYVTRLGGGTNDHLVDLLTQKIDLCQYSCVNIIDRRNPWFTG
jgi:hypothetical protein